MKLNVCSVTGRVAAFVLLSGPLLSAAGDSVVAIEQLAAEIKAVKAELLEVRLELEASRIARLRAELEAATKNRQRFEARERTANQELMNFDQHASARSPDEDGPDREATRKELIESISRETQRRQEAGRNESAIVSELQLAQQKLAVLIERAGKPR